jgi:hypothetical protein
MGFLKCFLTIAFLSLPMSCGTPLIAGSKTEPPASNTGATTANPVNKPLLQVEAANYLDKIKLTNNSGRKLTLKITESIDGELARSFQHDLDGSGDNSQWQFTPTGWDEHSFIQSRQKTTTPRTDREGTHIYQLTVSTVDGFISPQSLSLNFYVKEKVLNVGRVRQEGSLWCWAASSQSILNYLGRVVTACELVNMARRGRIWPWENKNVDCCKDGPGGEGCNFGLGAESGIFNILTGPSTYDIMKEQGFTAKVESGAMAKANVVSNIDDGNPFMVGVQPHFIVARGYRAIYSGSSASGPYRLYLHVMDPLVYPHYFLVGHDDISQAGGNYLGLKDPWVASITNIQSTTPIADQSGWIEIPQSAIANLPFEIRMQGLNKPNYAVEWFSPSTEAVKVSESENSRASVWTATTPGLILIGAKVYEDNTKKVLLSEKQLKTVSITPMPNLVLSVKGSAKDSLTFDLNTPGFGQPLELFMKLQARFGGKKVPIDVEKVNVLPVWRCVDQEGHEVTIKSADDLLSDKLLNGIYTAEFIPPPSPGKYTITGVLNDVNGKTLATSNAITINYLSPLSIAETEVLTGEENQVKCNITAENMKKFELRWEFSAEVRLDNVKSAPAMKVLKSEQAGKKFARLLVRALEDKTGKPLDPAKTFEVAWEVRAEKKPSVRIDGKKLVLPEEAVLLKAIVEAEPKILSTLRLAWYEGSTLLGEGETIGFSAGDPKTRTITIIAYGKRQEREVELTRASADLVINRPGVKDGAAFTSVIENLPSEAVAGSAIHPRANSFRQGNQLSIFDEKAGAAALQKKWEDYCRAQITAQQLDEIKKGGKAPAIPPRPSGWGVEKFKVVWRSTPSITFSPTETINNADASAQVAMPGSFEIWGEILRQESTGFKPVGETAHQILKATSSVLNVKMQSPDRPLKPGEIATISAAVTGGKEPYRFEWSGDHAGSGSSVQFIGRKPGSYQLAVQVADAAGAAGAASIKLTIEGIQAKIVGLPEKVIYGTRQAIALSMAPPAAPPTSPVTGSCPYNHNHTNPFQECDCTCDKCKIKVSKTVVSIKPEGNAPPPPIIGSTVSAKPAPASVKTGTKDGNRTAIWQSTPGLTFEPSTSEDMRTTVLFDRMGKIKIWAEILQKVEGVITTAGEADVQEVEVVAPRFSLQFDPPTGKVGQEIRATIKTIPEINDSLVRYLWSSPASSNRMEYSENSNKIGFVMKDAKPSTLQAEAKVPYWADHIGDVNGNYSATLYTVKATVLGGIGPKPQVWKEGVGLVAVEQGSYAADQQVRVKAELKGDPLPSEVHWQWSVNDATTLASVPIAQEVTASRHDVGTAELTVVATDKNKVVLGQASTSFNVTVSDVDLKEAVARAAQVTVSLTADANNLKLSEFTTLRSTVKGGKPPYNYVWTGDCAGSGTQARFTAKKGGTAQITLTVSDSAGRKGVAVLALNVAVVKLPVTLVADRLELRAAHVAAVQAQVKGGKPPFSYRWSGGVIEGQGAAVKFKAGKEGTQQLQVEVTDAQGSQGSAVLSFKVLPLIASFNAHPREVPLGGSLPLSVTVMQSGPTPPGYSSIVFKSSSAIRWAPAKCADGQTTATFTKPGSVRIWAEIWQGEGAGASSSGKTAEDEIIVVAPKFELVFDPPRGGVGREIRASVKSTPEMDPGLFRLSWIRRPAGNNSAAGNETISFIPADYSPQDFIVDVIAVDSGETLTQVSGQFVPAVLAVKARINGTVGAPPQLFRNGKLEAVKDAYAVNQRIRLEAAIEGGSEDSSQAQFSWSVKGGTIESNKAGPEIIVYRTSPGDCTATVVAKNKAGGKIGQADVLVRVTISKDDLERAQKENNRQGAIEKLAQAEQLAAQNKIEDAMVLVNEAAPLEPQNAAATKKNVASQASFHGWRAVSDLDFPTAVRRLELALQLDPVSSETKQRLTQARAWKLDWEKALGLEQEISNLLGAQKLVSALKSLDQVHSLIQPIPAASKLTPWYNSIVARCDQARREYETFLQPLRQNIQKQMNLKAYQAVVSLCQQALQRELFPSNDLEMKSWLESAQGKLNPAKTAAGNKPPSTTTSSAGNAAKDSPPQGNPPPLPNKTKGSWLDKLGKTLDTIGQKADQISKTMDAASSSPSNTSSTSKTIGKSPAKVYENGNTGGCGFTDTSNFQLNSNQVITDFSVWYSWRSGETALPYRILKDGKQIYSGTLHKSDCDPNQTQWCNGKESLNLNMGAGSYTLKLNSSRMCQNAESGGNGMIRVFSGAPVVPPSTTATTKESPATVPASSTKPTQPQPSTQTSAPSKTPSTSPTQTSAPSTTPKTPPTQTSTPPKTPTPPPQSESCPYNHNHTNPFQDCNCTCEKCRIIVK